MIDVFDFIVQNMDLVIVVTVISLIFLAGFFVKPYSRVPKRPPKAPYKVEPKD